MGISKCIYHLAFFSILYIFLPHAHTFAQDSTTAEGLYTLARHAAFKENNNAEALRLCHKALSVAPGYTDILIFAGRLHAWSRQPDSARIYFAKALNREAGMEDAYIAYTDLEYWEKNYDTALAIVSRGLEYNTGSVPLLLRKSLVLYAKKEYKIAAGIVDTLIQKDKKNTEIRALANLIKDNIAANRVGLQYDYVYFDKQFPDPWHLASIYYTRQTKIGAFTARLNYADRFKTEGLQYEAEAYPILSKTFYTYLNLGYSDKAGIFPQWKGGASLYANLPAAFEAAAGIRFLHFTSNTFIYQLYIGKYYKNFLFGAQTYLAPVSTNISQTYSFLARYYYGDIDDYIGINIGGGISPDDRQANVQLNNPYKLRTCRGELTIQHAIQKLNIFTVNISLLNQEYLPNTVGNQVQAGIRYVRRF